MMERAIDEATQCKYVGQSGQCVNVIHEGATSKCLHHGGYPEAKKGDRETASSYRLHIFKNSMAHHLNHSELKNVRSEIALLRVLIESKVNLCKDDYDLMLQSASISDLLVKVNTLVTSCHRLETASGELMDKQTLAGFATDLVDVVSKICNDDQMDDIAEGILCLMKTLD